jgi:hypothetical protein
MPSLVWKALKKMNKHGASGVIFIHSWELDSKTPKLRLCPYKSFVTYHNIEKMVKLFERLLGEFQFISFAEHMKATKMV